MTNNEVLRLVEVKKQFLSGDRNLEILKNVNLLVKKSEFISLIGPSGSGKTTLIQIAGLLDNPTSGKVIINQSDISNANDHQRTELRKDHIGFVFQFHHLLPEFSVIENVALPLLIKNFKKERALIEASEILERVGLKDKLHHRPAELSGGQQQRVAIARAVITKPSLILADEPTGNLDSSMSSIIFELLKDLTKNLNLACLIVTHNLELAKKTDFSMILKDGELKII
jgi:lipoprotein-releasing system ATP-binding protein